MGSKGKIDKGDFRKDYANLGALFVTYKSPIDDSDIDYIEEQCGEKFSEEIRQRINNEINENLIMKEMQDAAPHKGGSGRVNDFFAAHIRALAKIFEDAGGKVTLRRKNPSRKHLNGFAKSPFLDFCYAVNDRLPSEMQRVKALDNNPNQGFTRAIRRVLNKDYV